MTVVFWVIVLIIFGNIMLFSGAIFTDFADDGIAWLNVIVAIAVDIYFIYLIAKKISKSHEQKRIANGSSRIADVMQKVDAIIRQYTPVGIGANGAATEFQIDLNYLNKEVILAVKAYKEKMSEVYDKYASVSSELTNILSCRGCHTVDDMRSHLRTNLKELKRLKREGDECIERLSHYKIELLNENRDLLSELKLAFGYLQNSRKCVSDSTNIEEFVSSAYPQELTLFKYDNEPVTLFVDQYYFCLFSNVILVFDDAGLFSTAIDPSALKTNITREIFSAVINNGNVSAQQFIDEDSKCIYQGATRSTWRHARRDGSPDLRYSDNPRMEYCTNIYEYVVIDFEIAEKKVSFSVSSQVAGESFETVIPKYCRKCNNRHNPIPELLLLMKTLSGDDDPQISIITSECAARGTSGSYFCKIIAV